MKYTNEQRKAISRKINEYIDKVGMADRGKGETGVNKLSLATGITHTYLLPILREETEYRAKDKKLPIPDKVYERLCTECNITLEAIENTWTHVNTSQFVDVITELVESKRNCSTRVIIGESGCGKTYSIDKFRAMYPVNTFVIKCFRRDSLNDLIRKIEQVMKLKEGIGSVSSRIDAIKVELFRKNRTSNGISDHFPILIFDESEALTSHSFGMLKALYDALDWHCGIVLIGTNDLLETMERGKKSQRPGMPQFMRRFKAGIRRLDSVTDQYGLFFKELNIPKDLQRMMSEICENFGELHDFYEPVARFAQQNTLPVTVEVFKSFHKL